MQYIKILKNPIVKNPVMIAGWPGMGSVALGVADYLKRHLKAVKFAEIRLDPVLSLDSVVVNNGVIGMPPPPKNMLYYTTNPDLIILIGETQVSGHAALSLISKVLDIAVKYNVRSVFTGAAFPIPISHMDDSEIYGAVNKKEMRQVLSSFSVKSMEGGNIAGLNGLILGMAGKKGIDATCLLATMPYYAVNLPNPKATAAIIGMLEKMIGFVVDLRELDNFIKDMDEKMLLIEDKVKDVVTIEKEDKPEAKFDKNVPGYILERIERLFKEARIDKSKAPTLKAELDRWDLYSVNEDRFLDIFKNTK